MRVRMLLGVGLLAGLVSGGSPAAAQEAPPPPATPRVHNSPCALAESMAGRLATKGLIDVSHAQQTCKMLVPTMTPENEEEFIRCCVQRLTQGPGAPPAKPKAKPDANGQQGT